MKILLSRYIIQPIMRYLRDLYYRILDRLKQRCLRLLPPFIRQRALEHPFFSARKPEKQQLSELQRQFESLPTTIQREVQAKAIEHWNNKTQEHEARAENTGLSSKVTRGIFRTVSTALGVNESNDVPIPPRKSKLQRQSKGKIRAKEIDDVYRPSYEISFSTSTSSGDFITEAKKYANRTEKHADPVPFMQYWPTYSSMDRAQQKWYFYWRTQLRQGNRLPTDTSYLFVHIYEVIHLIGFKSPKNALKYLAHFWRYYRKLQPKLDNYLPDWIADFIVIHKLPVSPLNWYSKIAKFGAVGDQDLLIEAWLIAGGEFDTLSNDVIYRLANYNPTKSKFYKQYAEAINLAEAYKKGLSSVDKFMQTNIGKSLFQTYQSEGIREIRRIPFSSAVHSYPPTEIVIASVHYWHSNEALGEVLKDIIKHTENIMRGQSDYRHKLRDIDLDPKWKSAIESTLKVETPKQKVEIDLSEVKQLTQESEEIRSRLIIEPDKDVSQVQEIIQEPEKPTEILSDNNGIVLDLTNIEQLQKDSEAVRDRLILDDIQLDDDGAEKIVESVPTVPQQDNAAGYLERPDNTPDDLLTDLQEVAQILGGHTDNPSKLIALMMANDWECTVDTLQSAFEGQFINVIIDKVNERAYEEIGDSLVYEEDGQWIVLEEYRDELQHILEHPEYQNQVDKLNNPIKKYDELDPEWATFADKLEPIHWDILAAILSRVDVDNRINKFAMQHYTTGNLTIDEINEFAQDCFEDILIDTVESVPNIVEDEQQNVNDLLNWAANRKIIEV